MDLSFARKHVEMLYVDTCSIIQYEQVKDPETHITRGQEVTAHENVPCKLSHKNIAQTTDGNGAALTLVSKLILSPDIQVPAGSKIIVTRNGVSMTYQNSSEPARYLNHQEIMLEIWKGWA